MEENVAESFQQELLESADPAQVLLKLYTVVSDTEYNSSYLMMFRKYVKIYGRKNMFFSILDLSEIEVTGNPIRLIAYFCKKRLETKLIEPNNVIDISDIQKRLKRVKKQ